MEDTTATAAPAEAAPEEPVQEVESMSVPTDPAAYSKWRETGELPAKSSKPSKDDSAPSKPSPDDSATSDKQEKRQESKRTESRKEEINREIREALAERDRIRAEVEALKGPAKTDVKAEPSPAPETQGPKRPVEPKQEDFKTWEEYDAAAKKYIEDLTEFKVAQILDARETKQRQESAQREMQVRLDEAKTRYGEEAEPKILETAKTVFDDKTVAPAIKVALGRSQVLVDALYVLGSDQKELSGFIELAKKDPLEALRKWFTVESLVKEELAKAVSPPKSDTPAPPRGADGKFQSDAKPAKREAPAPPTILNGNSSPVGDPREGAANAGDFRTFKRTGDSRDIARSKGQL